MHAATLSASLQLVAMAWPWQKPRVAQTAGRGTSRGLRSCGRYGRENADLAGALVALAAGSERHGFTWQVAPGLRARAARLGLTAAAAAVPARVDARWLAARPEVQPRDATAAAAAAVLLLAAVRGCLADGHALLVLLRALDAVCKEGLGDAAGAAEAKPSPSPSTGRDGSRVAVDEAGARPPSTPQLDPCKASAGHSSGDTGPQLCPDTGGVDGVIARPPPVASSGAAPALPGDAWQADPGPARNMADNLEQADAAATALLTQAPRPPPPPGQPAAPRPALGQGAARPPPQAAGPVPPPPPPQRADPVAALGLGGAELEMLTACLGVDARSLPPGSDAQQRALLAALLQARPPPHARACMCSRTRPHITPPQGLRACVRALHVLSVFFGPPLSGQSALLVLPLHGLRPLRAGACMHSMTRQQLRLLSFQACRRLLRLRTSWKSLTSCLSVLC